MKTIKVLISLLILSCSLVYAQNNNDYLGQKFPGSTPQLFAPGIVSSGNHDMDITISPDGNEIFFTRCGINWYAEILYVQRTENGWQDPVVLPWTITRNNNYPFVSPDGNYLLFESKVKSKEGDGDNREVFYCKKTKRGWSKAVIFDNGLNTEYAEMYTSISLNGTIYFCANYPESNGRFDIYKFNPDKDTKAVNLGDSINNESNEFHPYIAPDESYIIFDASREEGFGSNDLYISFKKSDGTWSKAVNMGKSINTPYADMRPFVTYDGKYMFFSSTRPLNKDIPDKEVDYKIFMNKINSSGNGSQDIYWVDAKIIDELKNKVL